MARLSRGAAILEMTRGGLLYVYVERDRDPPPGIRWPAVGAGAIVGDNGLSHIGRRTVRAIQRMGTKWDHANKAEVFTDDAKRRAVLGASPIWFWQ